MTKTTPSWWAEVDDDAVKVWQEHLPHPACCAPPGPAAPPPSPGHPPPWLHCQSATWAAPLQHSASALSCPGSLAASESACQCYASSKTWLRCPCTTSHWPQDVQTPDKLCLGFSFEGLQFSLDPLTQDLWQPGDQLFCDLLDDLQG